MSIRVRDSEFDVAVLAGPGLDRWPSEGVRVLTSILADFGLKVGAFGGDSLIPRGILPLESTGAQVILEDSQHRIHRIRARAVVRWNEPNTMPDPFPGWISSGLVPLRAARKLLQLGTLSWEPGVALLGTGNASLRFGTRLLEMGLRDVLAVETAGPWGKKIFSSWEVERRRFEMMGGKLVVGKPLSLEQKSPHVWTIRIELDDGVRMLDVFKVISAGPFSDRAALHEYPPRSLLFEMDQTAPEQEESDPEGYRLEMERSQMLAVQLVKSLHRDLGGQKAMLDRLARSARFFRKNEVGHRENPHEFQYSGKWLNADEKTKLKEFPGVPKELHIASPKASVECFEDISCVICQKVCPEAAISLEDRTQSVLSEKDCTGCGICVAACPSQAIALVKEGDLHGKSQLTLAWRGKDKWQAGETSQLLNRRGEFLGSTRVESVQTLESNPEVQLIQFQTPSHFVWDARMVRHPRGENPQDPKFLLQIHRASVEKVEVFIDGEKRLARPKIPVVLALHELGGERPEDKNLCMDGSCGLCAVWVDGIKRLGCKEQTRRGMAIRLKERFDVEMSSDGICPCKSLKVADVEAAIRESRLQSPEAVADATGVCEGKCLGQLCREPFRRLLERNGIQARDWIDWRFPFSEWSVFPQRDQSGI